MSCEDNIVRMNSFCSAAHFPPRMEVLRTNIKFTVYGLLNRNRLKYLFWICKKYNYRVIKYFILKVSKQHHLKFKTLTEMTMGS